MLFFVAAAAVSSSDHENVPLWIQILLGLSYTVQLIISFLILCCYKCNPKFREKPGSIILFYGISAFAVTVLAALNHYTEIGKDDCETMGFLALFFEYSCLNYELGFIIYFIYDFEEMIKSKFQSIIVSARSRIDSFIVVDQGNLSEVQNEESSHDNLERDSFGLEKISQKIQEEEVSIEKIQSLFDERYEQTQALFEKSQNIDDNFSRAFLQTKINFTVLIVSLTSAAIPAFSDGLGLNLFGGCSGAFHPDELQKLSLGFYLLLAAITAVFSALGLISFRNHRERLQKDTLASLMLDKKETEEIDHYLNHVYKFLVVTTVCCWIFSGINIYADITVLNAEGVENPWGGIKSDFLLILHLIQGFTVLWFKLFEPMVWNAVKATFQGWSCGKSICKFLSLCTKCLGSCFKKKEKIGRTEEPVVAAE